MSKKKLTYVNVDNLKTARENSGFSTLFISEKYFRKKVDVVLGWESGADRPTLAQVKQLAEIYDVPWILFLSKKKVEKNFLKDKIKDFRSKKIPQESNPDLQKLINIVINRQQNIERIYEREGWLVKSVLGSGAGLATPKQLAGHIVNSLGISIEKFREKSSFEDALKYLIERAEDKNIFVGKTFSQHRNISVDDMRGVCLYHEKHPFIVINRKDGKSGQIFTLLHEFAHLFRNTSAISNVIDYRDGTVDPEETFCNKVAAEILLPESTFTGRYNFERIVAETKNLKVAAITLFYRLKDFGLIDGDVVEIERKIKERSDGFRQNEKGGGDYNNNMKDTNGGLYNRLISGLYFSEKMGWVEARGLLGMNPEKI